MIRICQSKQIQLTFTSPGEIRLKWRQESPRKFHIVYINGSLCLCYLNHHSILKLFSSDLPHNVNQEEALTHAEVRRRLNAGLQMLQAATLVFLQRICDSKTLIPYGLLYIARTLRQGLLDRFPGTQEKDVLKVMDWISSGNYYNDLSHVLK